MQFYAKDAGKDEVPIGSPVPPGDVFMVVTLDGVTISARSVPLDHATEHKEPTP